jgi:predicted GNAT superfamily acetyltransferase
MIETRVLSTISDLKLVQKLEKVVWDMDPLPLHQTITASKNGGLLLGFFIDGELAGFSYSFSGFHNGHSYLCSHMLGVHPDHQEKGIGAKLKQMQKEIASEMGYELIVWTFDLLETRNAYLNLSKLHAICSSYEENCYGEMDGHLNHSLPSDRFKMEWWIDSQHVKEPLVYDKSQAQFLFHWEVSEDGWPRLLDINEGIQKISDPQKPICVPVPVHFQQLKSRNMELALDWRYKTREIFQTLFAKGYAVVSLLKSENEAVHYYLLVQKQNLQIHK